MHKGNSLLNANSFKNWSRRSQETVAEFDEACLPSSGAVLLALPAGVLGEEAPDDWVIIAGVEVQQPRGVVLLCWPSRLWLGSVPNEANAYQIASMVIEESPSTRPL